MEIQINYSARTKFSDEEINQVITLSQSYGDVKTQKMGSRSGAIDLVTTLEIIFMSSIAKPILNGFLKGLFGEEYFNKLGSSTREGVTQEIQYFKSYLNNLYRVFISKRLDDEDAIAIVEHINGIVYYAVLNHKRSTEKLISELPESLVRAVGEVSLKRIPVLEPFTVQLYPNFEKESWDYLFIPTVDGFGNFIDRYFDFNTNQVITLNTKDEFYEIFDIDDSDTYKQIISAKYQEERQKN